MGLSVLLLVTLSLSPSLSLPIPIPLLLSSHHNSPPPSPSPPPPSPPFLPSLTPAAPRIAEHRSSQENYLGECRDAVQPSRSRNTSPARWSIWHSLLGQSCQEVRNEDICLSSSIHLYIHTCIHVCCCAVYNCWKLVLGQVYIYIMI